MATAVAIRTSSGSSGGLDKHMDSSGKYVRYTLEQVEALERVYAESPKPSSMRRQQLISECPILSNIEPKQIKVWFQNRRCREKQRKEASCLQAVNRKLTAMNKLLMEENERLQKQVAQLVQENAYMRQQLQNPSLANDTSCESVVTTPQNPLRDTSNPAGLLSIAEETLAEFLSKATGTAVNWVQMPGMKPGPDSIGIVAISQTCSGVAARACGLVSLEPTKGRRGTVRKRRLLNGDREIRGRRLCLAVDSRAATVVRGGNEENERAEHDGLLLERLEEDEAADRGSSGICSDERREVAVWLVMGSRRDRRCSSS